MAEFGVRCEYRLCVGRPEFEVHFYKYPKVELSSLECICQVNFWDSYTAVTTGGLPVQEKRQQAVFNEWKELEKELDEIGQVSSYHKPTHQELV